MRRFVDTFAGKALCHLAVMALVLPTVTLASTGKAVARQVTQLPTWAVTEFKDQKGANAFKYGQVAADAVSSELAKTNRYDVVPQDTVKRAIETLGLTSPPEGLVNLTRIGQEVVGPGRTGTVVEGQVLDYQVRQVGGGKQAIVALRMVAYDVASGLPVNGALDKGESTIRPNSATNEALIADAIAQAAAITVRTMQGQQLPTATVLNTGVRTALLNQGTRSGFKTGDTVIITRGNLQVGTGRIGTIEPDQAEMTVERELLGLAPGDRVRAVFSPPALPVAGRDIIKSDGSGINVPNRTKRSGGSNNATLISALLVVGLVAVLLSGGNSNSTTATASTSAEATIDTDNISPAVRIKWSPNGFYKGTGTSGNGVQRWQIYRTGVPQNNPVLVIGNARNSAVDSSRQDNSEFPTQSLQLGVVGGTTCLSTSPSNTARTAPALLTPGTPYTYSVEAVYRVSSLDLPTPPGTTSSTSGTTTSGNTTTGNTTTTTSGNTTTGGGATAGTTTTTTAGGTSAGGTTAGNTNTGGTTSGQEQLCYFQSGRSFTGQATPLSRPSVNDPVGPTDLSTVTFNFVSNQGVGAITPEYVIEFSNDPNFNKKYTVRINLPNASTTQQINVNSNVFNKKGLGGVSLAATGVPIYYRIGVRNSTDKPGPVPDGSSGKRYIYSVTPNPNVFFQRLVTNTP